MFFPVLFIGQTFAGSDWLKWAAVLGGASVFWLGLVHLHELNENIRYVRHQLRVQRDAVHEVVRVLEQYRNRENFSLADALELLDGKWERP